MGWLKLTQEFQSACLSGELLRGEMKTRRTDIHPVQMPMGLGWKQTGISRTTSMCLECVKVTHTLSHPTDEYEPS